MENQEKIYDGLGYVADFLKTVMSKLDEKLMNGISTYFESVVQSTRPIFAAAVVLYICWVAYEIMFRQKNISDLMPAFIKIIAIGVFAFSWAHVYQYVADPIMNGVPQLINNIVGQDASEMTLSFADKLIDQVKRMLDAAQEADGSILFSMTVALITTVCIVLTVLLICYYFFLIIVAKVQIAVYLILAPIFIGFAMFDKTKGFFSNWVNGLFSPVMTLLVLNLIISFMGGIILSSLSDAALEINLTGAILGMVLVIVMILLCHRAHDIAQSLVAGGYSAVFGTAAREGASSFSGRVGSYSARIRRYANSGSAQNK